MVAFLVHRIHLFEVVAFLVRRIHLFEVVAFLVHRIHLFEVVGQSQLEEVVVGQSSPEEEAVVAEEVRQRPDPEGVGVLLSLLLQ